MRHHSKDDQGTPWPRRPRLPNLPIAATSEGDPFQSLFAFAYLQAQGQRRFAVEEMGKEADALSAVLEAQHTLAVSDYDLHSKLDFIAEQARKISGAGGAVIALAQGDQIVCRARAGLIGPHLGARLDPYSGISGECIRTGEILHCEDTETDPRVNLPACRTLGIRSILAVPLIRQDQTLGLLEIFSGWAGVFGYREQRTLKLLAGQIIEVLWAEETRSRQGAESRGNPAATEPPTATTGSPASEVLPQATAKASASATSAAAVTPPASAEAITRPRASAVAPSGAAAVPTYQREEEAKPAPVLASALPSPTVQQAAAPGSAPPPLKVEARPAHSATSPVTPAQSKARTPSTAASSPKPVKADPVKAAKPLVPAAAPFSSKIEPLAKPAIPPPVEAALEIRRKRTITPPVWIAILTLVWLAGIFVFQQIMSRRHATVPPVRPGDFVIVPQLPAPTVENGTPAMPASSVPNAETAAEDSAAPILKSGSPEEMAQPEPAPTSAIVLGPAKLTEIRHHSKSDSTSVGVYLDAPVKYVSATLHDPERLFFDLKQTTVGIKLPAKQKELIINVNDHLVSTIRVAQKDIGLARVVIDLKVPAEFTDVLSSEKPYRLMIAVRKSAPKASADPTPERQQKSARPPSAESSTTEAKVAIADAKLEAATSTDAETKSSMFKPASMGVKPAVAKPMAGPHKRLRIVIDPGHGGEEEGAIGPQGLKEKDLVLDIARRLGKRLKTKLNAEIYYTRTADASVALEERSAMANQLQADMFISIHANSSSDPNARGVETYYVAKASSSHELEVAARENATATNQVRHITADNRVDAPEKIERSRKLAAFVQQALYSALANNDPELRNRGVKRAPFVVLLGAEMPSILAEVSFVSSPADERELESEDSRNLLADALYRGIAKYVAATKPSKPALRLASIGGK